MFYSDFEERISKSPLPAPFSSMEPAGQWLFLLLLFIFFSPCPKHNIVHKCEYQSLMDTDSKTHFASACFMWWLNLQKSEVPKPDFVQCQYWDNYFFFLSCFYFFFFSFLLFAFCNAAWEHRLTLYPWPDSWTKNSSHSATRVQSHRRQIAAGKQGGQISPCSQNQTHDRSTEDSVCWPPLKTVEQGQEIGTGA